MLECKSSAINKNRGNILLDSSLEDEDLKQQRLSLDSDSFVEEEKETHASKENEDSAVPVNDNADLTSEDISFKEKVTYTMCLAMSFLSLGLIHAQTGPSFLDLLLITHTTLAEGSTIFTGTSIGYLVGSLVNGVLHKKINTDLMLFISIFGAGSLTAVIPWCTSIGLMVTVLFIQACFMGSVDTSINTACINIWGKDNGPYMQALQFSLSVGGILSPLITSPFLVQEAENNATISDATGAISSSSSSTTIAFKTNRSVTNSVSSAHPPKMQLYLAYTIVSVLSTLTTIPFLFFFLNKKSEFIQTKQVQKQDSLCVGKNIFILILLMTFNFSYCGLEDATFDFLASFVIRHLKWSKTNGSILISIVWGTFAFGQLIAIFIIKFVNPVAILTVNLVLLFVAEFGLLQSEASPTLVWVCSSFTGLAMSSIFPSMLSWAEVCLLKVTNKVVSYIMAASSGGTALNPILVGYLFDEYTPKWLIYILVVQTMMCIFSFVMLYTLSRHKMCEQNNDSYST